METLIKELKNSVSRVDALDKITGKTKYLNDIDFGKEVLHAKIVHSTKARAKILKINIPELPEGYSVIDYKDVPGKNAATMIISDWRPFADDNVRYIGETILLIVGPDKNVVYDITEKVTIEYEDLEPVLNIEDSKKLLGGPIYGDDNIFISFKAGYGDVDEAFKKAKTIIEETYHTPYQEHLYMEVNGTVGVWENDGVTLYSSTQCPYYVQKAVAPVLGVEDSKVRVISPTIGGGFGGKEHYPDILSAAVAVAVHKLKKTVKLILDRQFDLAYSVKRQPAQITTKIALDENNNIIALDVVSDMDAGAYESSSRVIMQRCTYTAANVYHFPNVRVLGRLYCTNNVPSCAFRGFGGPQAIFAIERTMDNIANKINVDPIELKRKYFVKQNDPTITGGIFHDNIILPKMLDLALKESDYENKVKKYKDDMYRGIGISCFLHGCAFTGSGERDIIKAKLKLKKKGNKVTILTSNTEIGQGLHTTFRKIAAYNLQIPLEDVDISVYDTNIIPNTGPTVASRSVMIVGYLIQEACKKLKDKWNESEEIEIIEEYKHPSHLVDWDSTNLRGDAYPTYGLGINVVEVEIDKFTLEVKIVGVWAVFDCGYPIDEKIVEGQIKGGVAQALGWGALENIVNKDGRFLQVKMSDYMIPTSLDLPEIKTYIMGEPYQYGPSGAKGIGEITFDGAASAYASAMENALKHHFTKIPILPENIAEVI
ncbi:xanthine dehydrogenase family protein molybdopterin-binding subunit [Brachyspira hyodysenteriae]|uniref:xanthine dehydrogenase family protein molybdopterin-binding subunit n=1 Tax=Brachyspira hyodysenteriae TaxID=159 RepID=UPI00063DB36B|nr:xanthine dehydrogenase family protein molybdopterin-binding subunit [Brachyspira hyodysenteriae]KLI25302.1 carbon monoxide dehydrogenase [Brachyspira hyodysenteriae]TVL61314.1 carbon monoxide dehydrogenase [Brachyspira hyodysenteriae]